MPLGTPRGTIIFLPFFLPFSDTAIIFLFLFSASSSSSSSFYSPWGRYQSQNGRCEKGNIDCCDNRVRQMLFFLSWGGLCHRYGFLLNPLNGSFVYLRSGFFSLSLSRGHHWLWRRLRGRRGRGLRRRRGRGGRRAVLRGRGLR